MKTRTILAATLAAALVAVPAILVAQSFGGRGPGAHGGVFDDEGFHMIRGFLGRVGDKIGLDDDQRAAIEAIVEAKGPAIREYIEQAAALRTEFASSHDPGNFDEQEFRAHAEERSRIQIEIKVASARAMAQVWNILTDEQKKELEELRELMGRRGRFGSHRGGPGAGGGGPEGS
jgi:Spy/CpxP family protein refolding chaperone